MLSVLGSTSLYSQEKYYTKSGYVTFDSRIDSFVPVKAVNNSASAVFDTNNGDIAVLAFVKDFNFKNSLLSDKLDLDYVEMLIREKFLFGKEEETIYIIKKNDN